VQVLMVEVWKGTLGNLITDAILDYRLGSGGRVDGAVMNAGSSHHVHEAWACFETTDRDSSAQGVFEHRFLLEM
jgi:hypothetical protein